MRSMQSVLLLLLLLWIADECGATEVQLCREKSCAVDTYEVIAKSRGGLDCSLAKSCVHRSLPPSAGAPIEIHCTRIDTFTHACEAWPRGSGLSYHWSPNGSFSLEGSGADIQLHCFDNTVGTVSVLVASPYGMGSSATLMIDCGLNVFGGP